MFQLKKILADLNGAIRSIGKESLISLFEAQVKCHPNKTAIIHNDESITYEKLNCRANAIADYLCDLGIKEGSIVTILLERSINLIAGIIGILKTGAAYVVIDADYPINRIEYILKDTNTVLLLTEKTYQDQLKYKNLLLAPSCQPLYLSELLIDSANHTSNPVIQSNGDTLACLIYTSGSTGNPKGTLLKHSAFFRLFNGPDMVQTSSSDCIAQIANASFDLAIYDMWAALGQGASLVIIDKNIALSPKLLESCFKKYNVTTALLPTGLFHQLVRVEPTIFNSLKNVLFAGEAANPEIIRAILNNSIPKSQRLFNLYGPTECAVFATYYEVKDLDKNATSVPIGIPVNDTELYVLNDNLEKVQTGEMGELYLGGIGLAKGYLNLPDLTAEKFIPCPFDKDCKLYKTGDLVKMLPDGNMDFIGRKDNQVKIRGFRIELDDVAVALESHPDIWKSVVLAPHTQKGHRKLIAYFIPKNKEVKIEVASIRSYLKEILPDYMIPGTIIQLDAFPLNPHGKIDRQALLNDPTIDSESLISLFETNVKLTPNKTAIFHNDQSISYNELNQQSNAIASYLFELGVKTDSVVAILLERSIHSIASILGVLKTGAAYVMIDSDYPINRIGYILYDTNADLLLTDVSYQEHPKYQFLLAANNCQRIYISELLANVQNHPDNPCLQSYGDTLACIVYTSGSTGNPKGTLLNHKAFFRLFNSPSMVQTSSSDCIAQISNASFDAAIYETWAALGQGGSLVIIDNDTVLSPQLLESCFKKYNITTAFLTTGLFNQLAKITPSIFKLLTNVLFGGEVANPEIVRKIINNNELRPQRLFHLYGPTECGVFTTYYEVKTLEDNATSVPIGVPINNTQVYILNDNLERVQPEEIGELYVSGQGIARGYLNLPDLTAEKFISCPFDINCKMYKTGDLVKYLPNGTIDFVGRKDNQVKVRGFRIELEEIESALESHPDIFQGIVLAPYIHVGHRKLVAYFVPKNRECNIAIESIRSHLARTLPDYMIPSTFIQLDDLPLTARGKIDRQALLDAPLKQEVDDSNEHSEITNMESLLLKIWKHCLGTDQIKLNDNFFDLGGDSIMIMQIIAHMAEHGITLKHSLILQHPTIQSLACLIEKSKKIVPEEVLDNLPFPLSAIQSWYFDLPLTNPNYFHHLFHNPLKETINVDCLKKAIQYLIHYHDVFRLRFLKDEHGYTQYYSKEPCDCVLEEIDTKDLLTSEVDNVIQDCKDRLCQSIDIHKGPLIRVALCMDGKKPKSFIMVIHHLIIDGISWRILMNDLDKLYKQLVDGTCCTLPSKTASFKTWAIKTREYALTKNVFKQASHWLNTTNSFVLPIDYQKGPNIESSNKILHKTLDPQTTQGILKSIPQAFQMDINDILLTAFFKTISKWSGQSEILLELEGHGREDIAQTVNLSRTVGWFTGLFPVSLKAQAKSLKSCLFEIHTLLKKIPTKGIGYGILKFLNSVSDIRKKLSLNPPIPIRFNYLGQFDRNLTEDQLFEFVEEPFSSPSDPQNQRTHLLIVECWVTQDQFQVNWHYSDNYHQLETIENLASTFNNFLELLIKETQEDSIDTSLIPYSSEEIHQVLPMKDEVQAVYPLTPIQTGLLFHAIEHPKSSPYFIQISWACARKYNAKAMLEAWDLLIRNHELLRATYLWEVLDTPIQVIHKQSKITVIEKDWRIFSTDEQKSRLNDYLIQDRQLGIDLKKAPLMRLTIIHMSDEKQLAIWSFHHIIMDNLSVCKIIEELDYYYSTLCSNSMIVEKKAPSFRKFIRWQKRHNYNLNKQFWQNYLEDFTVANQLSFKKEIDSTAKPCYTQFEYNLSQELSQRLNAYAKNNQLTLNAVMQGMWAYLLSIYSNTSDVVFGVTVSTRNSAIKNVHNIVGPLINTLPFRVIVDKDLSLLEYLKKVQNNLAEIIDHSSFSHIDIQRASEVMPGTSLFYSFFNFESQQIQELEERLAFFYNIKTNEITHYPLSLYVIPDTCIKLKVSFNPLWYDIDSVNKLIDSYASILSYIDEKANPSLNEFKQKIGIQLTEPNSHSPDIIQDKESSQRNNGLIHNVQNNQSKSKISYNEIKTILTNIWAEILQKRTVGIEDNFFDIGGDSLESITVISRVNKEFKINLSVSKLFDAPTIAQFTHVVQEMLTDTSCMHAILDKNGSRFIIPLQIKGNKKPLFLIHPIGGTVFCYVPLRNYIHDRPLYAIEDPGIHSNSLTFSSLEELASYYLESIKQIQPEGPYLLGGLSLGGLIAIEIAKQLNAQGESIQFIGLFDAWASYPEISNQKDWFEKHMDEQHQQMNQQLLQAGLDPKNPWLDLQWHRKLLSLKYRISSIPNKVTLFKAKTLIEIIIGYDHPTNFWENYCNHLEVKHVSGDHYSMFNHENIKELAETLKGCMP